MQEFSYLVKAQIVTICLLPGDKWANPGQGRQGDVILRDQHLKSDLIKGSSYFQ
jgi:hypothetical protein